MLPAAAADPEPVTGWLTWGNAPSRAGAAASAKPFARRWLFPLEGRVTSQVLVARNVPERGASTLYVATSAGRISALAPNGYVRWDADLGQLARPCPQLNGYGVTGTPAIDPETRALYAADPFGRLHALDLATGAERPGWPVRIFGDIRVEHVFGGLLVVRGSVYVPTASFCDNRMEGKLVRVSLADRTVTSWVAVPLRLGGGGGMWGFGGSAYSARRDSLFVATGNAFRGGENSGGRFREWAGYGEQLVELTPDLRVRAASHPRELSKALDLDFSSGPVVFAPPGCAELVAALNKNGTIYAWRADRVRAGPVWSVRLKTGKGPSPVIGQPAYSPRHRALFVATGTRLVRVSIGADCHGRVGWSRPLADLYTHGSPTVAGDAVWLAETGRGLLGVDARTGRVLRRERLHGIAYAAPTVVDGALYIGTYSGALQGFLPAGARAGRAVADRTPYSSFSDAQRGWLSRESGVYATDDGGTSWRRIHRSPAVRVLRLSERAGLIAVGNPAPRCACRTRVLWTADGGTTWHETTAVGDTFAGRGRLVFWHDGTRLYKTAWPPRRSVEVARVEGSIVALAPVPAGVAALVSSRVRGHGWDHTPRVLVYRGGRRMQRRLPWTDGSVLVRSLSVRWPAITVRGTNFTAARDGVEAVVWASADGGRSWRLVSGTASP